MRAHIDITDITMAKLKAKVLVTCGILKSLELRRHFLPEQGGLCDLVRLEEGFHPWHPDASGDPRLAAGAHPPFLSPGQEIPIKHEGFNG